MDEGFIVGLFLLEGDKGRNTQFCKIKVGVL